MGGFGGAGQRAGGATGSDDTEIIAKWTNISYTGGNKIRFNCLYFSAVWVCISRCGFANFATGVGCSRFVHSAYQVMAVHIGRPSFLITQLGLLVGQIMNISEGEATFYAAVIAAAISLVTLIFTFIASSSADLKAARRATLSSSFSELGALLYELVALSVKMKKMKSGDNFDLIREQAEKASEKVDELRRKTRYPLWGLDGGLRTIRWVPVYIAHLKNERDGARAGKIIELSTSLRESIDRAICYAYFTGQPPTTNQKLFVWWRARCLRRYFDGSKNRNEVE